jgi:hypothetical protein
MRHPPAGGLSPVPCTIALSANQIKTFYQF